MNNLQLPVRLGELGMPILSKIASEHFESSNKTTDPLVANIILRGDTQPEDNYVKTLNLEEKTKCEKKLETKAAVIEKSLSPSELQAISDAKDPGASNWLSGVPLEEYNFVLNKKEFRDPMNLRYGMDLQGLPSKCPCGQSFNMTHALNCKT